MKILRCVGDVMKITAISRVEKGMEAGNKTFI